MTTTINYTVPNAALQYSLEQAVVQYNAASGESLTPAQYLARELDARLQDLGGIFARITIADALARLTASEFGRINAARAASPQVEAATRPIFTSRSVLLGGPQWIGGVNALAAVPLLDAPVAARQAALLLPPQPGETVVSG